MASLINLLIQLQGKATVEDRSQIKGPHGEETHVWSLSDGSSIVIHATSRTINGKSAAKFQRVERNDQQSFKTIVSNCKRKYTMLRKKEMVQLCI